jgi:soluble lytic murein transglycosylase-like protein
VFPNEHDFDDIVYHWSNVYGVPQWVILTTIGKESSFNPGAFNGADPGGGSRGLMQIELTTARSLGYSGPSGDDSSRQNGLYDPSLNVQLGSLLLSQLAKRFPSIRWDGRYSVYNVGHVAHLPNHQLVDQAAVDQWGAIASYFNPQWKVEAAAAGAEALPYSPPPSLPDQTDNPDGTEDQNQGPPDPRTPRAD